MATQALVGPNELSTHLGKTVDNARAASAERVAWGWLSEATGLAQRPEPVPDDLWAWALELSALVYTNPKGLASDGAGPFVATRERGRREAILAAAARRYGTSRGPSGSFPPAQAWPDPACPYGW